MKVLVIDTALGACTVGVFDADRPLSARSEVMSKGHAERIGGLVRDAVAEAGEALGGFEALDRIGVTVGPGSFTGLRVGLSFAQGLGAALDIPVVGVSTLQALAWSRDASSGLTAAVVDARRGQVYLQTFRDGVPETPAEAVALETARTVVADAPFQFAGSGAGLIAEVPGEVPVDPTAAALAALTIAADPAEAPPTPLYLRAPDATPPTRLPGQARTPAARP
jgi:tRNA threonylcarbamoyladenosine biosynthesis protein TsaB